VDVPLPLGLEPVVPALGLAELAAGSPVFVPLPLGAPLCASAIEHVPRIIPTIIAISFMVSSRVSEQGQYWRSDLVPGALGPHAASHVYHASSDPTRSRSAEAVGAAQGARRQARTKSANICCG
jgi:hypothetical protein